MEKYFKVNAKCGHVGRGNFINIDFAVVAFNAKEAAAKTRNFGRVKHHYKDAINFVEEIDFDEFNKLVEQLSNDPYISCDNIQDQRRIEDFYERISSYDYEELKKDRCVEYKIKKRKILEETARLHIKEFAI